ncbi:MAG: transcriptional repressor [Dysgonamonadaceae bacterium]|jgi:Fur family ferric uptake transcriptional regulator|nr:transcriptional repressor [Dysgonamonadaceae bacterium]
MNYQIIEILEKYQIKPTPMRMLVLEQLRIARKLLSLSEIEAILYPADRVTIYRTLQTFVRKRIAHMVDTLHTGAVYGLCTDSCIGAEHCDEHPHFICEYCKTITCTNDFSYIIRKNLTTAQNYEIHKIEVTIKGICPNCTSKR